MPALNWIGKDAVINHHLDVPFHLLKDVPGLGCGDPGSGNLIVEGDNLVALKALLPYYARKVKCVCIDPPYNTGNEGWAYNDNVKSPAIQRWLGETVGKEGETLDRHDRWLCMMYPRLALLRDFLTKDGVILVHIDDNEVQSLRAMMDDIFGRKNFITQFVWQTQGHTDNQFHVKVNHEYVVMYAKRQDAIELGYVIDPNTREESNLRKGVAENSITKNGPGNPASEIVLPKGFPIAVEALSLPASEIPDGLIEAMKTKRPPTSNKLKAQFGKVQFPLRLDEMIGKGHKLAKSCRVFSGWANANKLKAFIENGCEPFNDDDGLPVQFYLSDKGVIYYRKDRGDQARNILSVLRGFTTTEKASSQLKLMGLDFSYPKPVDLTRYLLRIATKPGELVLDSFAGSGTTGAAALDRNADEKHPAPRNFILIQMPTESEEQVTNGVNLARDRTRYRMQKVCDGYTTPQGEKVRGLDDGFRYVQLGEELFDEHGRIRENEVRFADLARHVYFSETGEPLPRERISTKSPLLGVHHGRAVYLLYNGILKDKTVDGGNVLATSTLEQLPPHHGPKVVYAAGCRFSKTRLEREGITFKQTPYAIRTR
jgi:adenine-specific DNA-methyltransferase